MRIFKLNYSIFKFSHSHSCMQIGGGIRARIFDPRRQFQLVSSSAVDNSKTIWFLTATAISSKLTKFKFLLSLTTMNNYYYNNNVGHSSALPTRSSGVGRGRGLQGSTFATGSRSREDYQLNINRRYLGNQEDHTYYYNTTSDMGPNRASSAATKKADDDSRWPIPATPVPLVKHNAAKNTKRTKNSVSPRAAPKPARTTYVEIMSSLPSSSKAAAADENRTKLGNMKSTVAVDSGQKSTQQQGQFKYTQRNHTGSLEVGVHTRNRLSSWDTVMSTTASQSWLKKRSMQLPANGIMEDDKTKDKVLKAEIVQQHQTDKVDKYADKPLPPVIDETNPNIVKSKSSGISSSNFKRLQNGPPPSHWPSHSQSSKDHRDKAKFIAGQRDNLPSNDVQGSSGFQNDRLYHAPPLQHHSLLAGKHIQGKSTMYRNETSDFMSNLKAMYGAQLYANSNSLISPNTKMFRDPAIAYVHHQNLKMEKQRLKKTSNLPSIPSEWHESKIQIPNSTNEYTNFDGPLGYQWTNHNTFFAESERIPLRQWENTKFGDVFSGSHNQYGGSSVGVGDGTRFTVMSYNILAPRLLEGHMYLYQGCDPKDLPWETRRATLFSEISYYKPDILCLQEVEERLMPEFDDVLYAEGYFGVYKRRTGDKFDGCAIYYKSSKFRFIEGIAVQYFQSGVPLLDRDNVGLLLKLEVQRGNKKQRLVVGTTHLLFNPKRQDIKIAQVQVLMAELDRLAFCGFDKQGKPQYHPTIITGDFNTEPYSPIAKLITTGVLPVLDERGEPVRTLRRKGSMEFLPPQLGISDQCQHYKVVHQRLRIRQTKKSTSFEIPCEDSNDYVNIDTWGDVSESPSRVDIDGSESGANNLEIRDSDISIGSGKSSASSKSFASRKAEHTNNDSVSLENVNDAILEEVLNAGTLCTFGSGEFSHNFCFRDVHGVNHGGSDGVATTKQNGWVCVDYIFYSSIFNDQLQKPVEGKLKLLRRLGLLSRRQCKDLGSIPRQDIPSDHFPVLADFLLKM